MSFSKKPMAVTATECDDINRAVELAKVKLQIGFMRRFDEGFLTCEGNPRFGARWAES